MRGFALLVCFMWPIAAIGQNVKLPTDVKADVGTFAVVRADTDCNSLRWVVLDAGLSLIPPELLKDSKSVVVMSGRVGRYRLLAYGALKDVASEPAYCVVIVGNAPPGPDPPIPPPDPEDPLTRQLMAVFAKETAANKVASGQKLAELYVAAADQVRVSDKPKVHDFFIGLQQAAQSLLGNEIPLVRREIATYLEKQGVPKTVDAPLDSDMKKLLSKEFTNLSNALRGCCP